jgi:hypothetical protein
MAVRRGLYRSYMTETGTAPLPPTTSSADRIAHLQMVQGVISRMGQNGFYAKTWSVSMMAAVFALVPADPTTKRGLWLVLIPAVVFWGLDAYYLRQERRFRKLFAAVVASTTACFSMDVGVFDSEVPTIGQMAFARTIWPVHMITVVAIALKAAAATGHLRVN